MKNTLFALVASTLVLSSAAHAGVNGRYKVSGSETIDGATFSFNGTFTVSKYKSAAWLLDFNDGTEPISFSVKFNKPLKELKTSQTVTGSNKNGTASATFTYKGGKNLVKFTYRSKDGSLRGSGNGSK